VSLSLLGRLGAARGGGGILTDPRGRGVFASVPNEIRRAKGADHFPPG
jgi:hypothetical protein